MRPATERALRVALDTFSGADGGADFANLRSLIEEMDRRAESGDAAAVQVINVVHQFARLIEVARKTAR